MIRLIQCMCPKRHAIMAVCYDTEVIDQTLALRGFQLLMEDAIRDGVLNRRCEICDAAIVEFQWEDAKTTFASIDEARPKLLKLEVEQALTRANAIARRIAAKN